MPFVVVVAIIVTCPLLQPRLAEKLGDRKNVGGTLTDQIRPIRGMTVEKIAAIKAKRLAKKRATIKADEDLGRAGVSSPVIATCCCRPSCCLVLTLVLCMGWLLLFLISYYAFSF